jgi:hypothetical protein
LAGLSSGWVWKAKDAATATFQTPSLLHVSLFSFMPGVDLFENAHAFITPIPNSNHHQ